MIVGASDRMLASGDIEFERPFPKILGITNSIAVLVAGDTAAHAEIFQSSWETIQQRLARDVSWVMVKEVVDVISEKIIDFRKRQTERLYLRPFGLDSETFLEKQAELSTPWVSDMSDLILRHKIELATIVAGLDPTGSHIYTIDSRGLPRCDDMAAFSSIGIGEWHASSQFMFARHTLNDLFPQTILLTYAAKKRSEVAPGVGLETDMFIIPELGRFTMMDTVALQFVDAHYQNIRKGHTKATEDENKAFTSELMALVKEAEAKEKDAGQQSGPKSPDSTPPTDSEMPGN